VIIKTKAFLPCPFCANEPTLLQVGYHDCRGVDGGGAMSIECETCEFGFEAYSDSADDQEQALAAKWNARDGAEYTLPDDVFVQAVTDQ